MIIVRLLSPGPFGWLAPPKSTRVQGADIVMESLRSLTCIVANKRRKLVLTPVSFNYQFPTSQFLLALGLVVSSPLMSHASACSNSTIRGSYALTIHGTIFLPDGSTLLIDGIDKITFDGKGNLR